MTETNEKLKVKLSCEITGVQTIVSHDFNLRSSFQLNQRDEESMSKIWDSILRKTSDALIDTDVTDEDLGNDDDHGSTLKRDVGDVEA